MIKLKQVMANFLDIIKAKANSEAVTKSVNQLTASEIEFLLLLVKNSSFKGEQIEVIYNTAVKLQNQYLELKEVKK
jgi:hypothetical protein